MREREIETTRQIQIQRETERDKGRDNERFVTKKQ